MLRRKKEGKIYARRQACVKEAQLLPSTGWLITTMLRCRWGRCKGDTPGSRLPSEAFGCGHSPVSRSAASRDVRALARTPIDRLEELPTRAAGCPSRSWAEAAGGCIAGHASASGARLPRSASAEKAVGTRKPCVGAARRSKLLSLTPCVESVPLRGVVQTQCCAAAQR